ncbi:hypothetical protein [Clostridium akagii]|uniref:hypothetical protein n=1 Tax=Clostridium akagii TaxID=91623 RepID=UPI00047A7235|nr:hypothetical protein [Clostridium akagii]
MIPALSLLELDTKINEIYDFGERRIVGIIFARYNISLVKNVIDECYQYWNRNSEKGFDILWPGYGEYLPIDMESDDKKILEFSGNINRVYFDLDKFISSKKEMNLMKKVTYHDKFELLLANYHDGHIYYNENIRIDLEKNLDNHYASIRTIMEFITEESRSRSDVGSLRRKMIKEDAIKEIKGIKFSKIISTTNKIISYLK